MYTASPKQKDKNIRSFEEINKDIKKTPADSADTISKAKDQAREAGKNVYEFFKNNRQKLKSAEESASRTISSKPLTSAAAIFATGLILGSALKEAGNNPMLNISAQLLNRIGTVLAMKALPDEAALHAYMRSAFKGIALLIAGSVLLGAVVAASLYVAYDQMLIHGYEKTNVLIITLGTAFALVVICFLLADKWLSERFGEELRSKSIIDKKLDYIRDFASESISGFVEGLCGEQKSRKVKK